MSEKIKFVVTDYIEADLDWEAKQCAGRGIDFECHQLKFLPEEAVLEKTRDADVILVNMVKITESLVSKWEKCKLVIRHGIGYDNVDVDALTRHGIMFGYQPDYCKEDVAEHAIALIFACARKLFIGRKVLEDSSARGQWDFGDIMPVYRMHGKKLGIIGCGRIGSRVLRKLRHFGFELLVCDPYLSDERKKALDIDFVDKETVFREADYITIHTPLNDDTRHIVNAETLEMMKPTAFVVNTSRGAMVNHDDLVEALKAGKIGGAAIDVYEQEPPPADDELFQLDNAILSPHLGWCSDEAGWEIRESYMEDVYSFMEGKPPRCWINPEVKSKGDE